MTKYPIPLILMILMAIALNSPQGFAQFPKQDLTGKPAVVVEVEKVIDRGNPGPVKMQVSVLERLYCADKIPAHLTVRKSSSQTEDYSTNGKLAVTVFPVPVVGEKAILYLDPINNSEAVAMFWRPDNAEQRKFTLQEIESLKTKVPLDAVVTRDYNKKLDTFNYNKMCSESSDIVVGTASQSGAATNCKGYKIDVKTILKRSGSSIGRSYIVANADCVGYFPPPKLIFFLQAGRRCASAAEPKFPTDKERKTFEWLTSEYKAIPEPYYAVLWTAAREKQVADIVKRNPNSAPKQAEPLNCSEIASIISLTFDRCYRIKKEIGMKGGLYVDNQAAIAKYESLYSMIQKNLGNHKLGFLPLTELSSIYLFTNNKAASAEVAKRRANLDKQLKKQTIIGGEAVQEYAPPAKAME